MTPNRRDPTGLIPTESDVTGGRAEFTCNCGWLDWNHISNSDSRTFTLFDDIQHIINNRQPNEWWAIRFSIQLGFEAGPISLERNLFDDYAAMPSERVTSNRKLEIAANVFMSANEVFEELQVILAGELAEDALSLPYIPGDIIIGSYLGVERLYSSFYAEEDLVSNLLGFYIGYQRHENPGTTSEDVHTEIRRLCGSVNVNGDTSNSLAVFRETYANGANLITGWQQWRPRFIPLTGCNTGLCGERRWPNEFQRITNLQTRDDNERGWVWYSRFVNAPPLQSIGEANRPNVYRIGG